MRHRTTLGLVLGLGLLAACDATKTNAPKVDTTHIAPTDHGAQLVIEYQGNQFRNAVPVYATPTDAFSTLTTNDFYTAAPAVITLKSVNDTVYVGYFVSAQAYSMDYPKSAGLKLSYTGSMSPSKNDSSKVKMGALSSIYALYTFDFNYDLSGQIYGKQALATIGDDFQTSGLVSFKNTAATEFDVVVFRPVTCADYAARTVSSKGITETRIDTATHVNQINRNSLADLKVTCNKLLTASGANTSRISAPAPVKAVDYIRSHR